MQIDLNSRLLRIIRLVDEEIGTSDIDEDRIQWPENHISGPAQVELVGVLNSFSEYQYQKFVEGGWEEREKLLRILPLNVRTAVKIIRSARIRNLEIT
jgi:hypothetical protein